MKVPVFLVPVCLSLFVFNLGCSGEDQSSGPPPLPKVVQAIEHPSPEPEKAPEAGAEKQAEHADREEVQQHDEPQSSSGDGPEKPSEISAQAPQAPFAPQDKPAPETGERPGWYVVKEGDTLSKIAAREDTMQDPLKWPILLRLNSDKLADLAIGDDFAARELPAGMELKYITLREAKEGLSRPSGSYWVANVMSAPTEAELVPSVVILSRQGFPVYVTRAHVKGKDYFRLRVGFFQNRKESIEEGEKIKDLLKSKEIWATKASHGEYEEVAGFLKTP